MSQLYNREEDHEYSLEIFLVRIRGSVAVMYSLRKNRISRGNRSIGKYRRESYFFIPTKQKLRGGESEGRELSDRTERGGQR